MFRSGFPFLMIFQFSRMKKISMISDNDAERFSLNIKLENDRTVFFREIKWECIYRAWTSPRAYRYDFEAFREVRRWLSSMVILSSLKNIKLLRELFGCPLMTIECSHPLTSLRASKEVKTEVTKFTSKFGWKSY